MIRILLVDDQNLVQQGIKSLLEQHSDLKVIGTAKDGRSAIKQIDVLRPDIVLLDIEMPGMDGITATKYITHLSPQTKVIILSSHENKKYLTQALMAGAKAYILKSSLIKDLRQAILAVNDGYTHIESRLLAKIFDPTNIKLRDSKSNSKTNKVNRQSQKSLSNQVEKQKISVNLPVPEIGTGVSNTKQSLLSQEDTISQEVTTSQEEVSKADVAQENSSETLIGKKLDKSTKKSSVVPTTVNSKENTSNLNITETVEDEAIKQSNLAKSIELDELDLNQDQYNHNPQPEDKTHIYLPNSNQFLPTIVPKSSSSKLVASSNNIATQLSVFTLKSKNHLKKIISKPQVLKYQTQLTQLYQLKVAQSIPIIRSLKAKIAQKQSQLSPIIRHWYQQGWLANAGLILLGTITVVIIHHMFS